MLLNYLHNIIFPLTLRSSRLLHNHGLSANFPMRGTALSRRSALSRHLDHLTVRSARTPGRARAASHDFFFIRGRRGTAEGEACIDEPEKEKKATDGAEDDPDDRARVRARVDARVGRGHDARVDLSSVQDGCESLDDRWS